MAIFEVLYLCYSCAKFDIQDRNCQAETIHAKIDCNFSISLPDTDRCDSDILPPSKIASSGPVERRRNVR